MRARLIATTLAALLCLGLAELAAAWLAGPEPNAADAPAMRRSEHVIAVSSNAELTPNPRNAPSLLLLGNSHTYALPGLRAGEPLRPDPGATLIDELAKRIQSRFPPQQALDFYLLSYPNFLPIEMVIRLEDWLVRGHHPDVVVLGLTWRNIARGSEVRHSIRKLLRDPELSRQILEGLERRGGGAALTAEIRELVQRTRREEAEAATAGRSTADEIDLRLTEFVGERVSLIGQSATIRARAYRAFNYGLASLLFSGSRVPTNDVVAQDLTINIEALEWLISELQARGTMVVCYQAPERSDLPALVDTHRREPLMAKLGALLESRGGLLLDARHAVPDEFWGWERDRPDASHFTEPGHQRLAEFLVEQTASRGVWSRLIATSE